ncbi:SRPBCC family protein [Dyadobacter sp. CY261]|uniref:SRPBCC family protein n=1 Tax=Dyadobacter sp. CY261 TaxID=2907203 RepID=UPI001F161641|nr:SRPBCC family protein [Dyadobacter sp. CY261]MCF0075556.1 SRPBCC family protein [Dyadobacter sp. CY261]
METNQTLERSQLNNPTARVLETVNVPIKVAFDFIQPIPLDLIFPGYNAIPAIVKTDEQELWITAGRSRTVTFADGNSAFESMLHVDYPNYFSYKLENFSSEGLNNLIERIDGAWVFIALDENSVLIDWKYVITARNNDARQIIQEHLLTDFQGMLEQAMKICKENLESKTM